MATRHTGGRRRKAGSLIIGGLASASALSLAIGSVGPGRARAGGTDRGLRARRADRGRQRPGQQHRRSHGTPPARSSSTAARCRIVGGTPTVANTRVDLVLGVGGSDVLTLDEANGALPKATMIGGAGDDTVTGGSGNDLLIGQSGNDTLLAKGGADRMFGGADNDSLTGGDADDQAFGEGGDDAMIWNPGDDTDLNEGGAGIDTTIVNGGNGAEQFTTTANGTRVRFDRLDPAPFAVDMGTTEKLVLNANGGDDSFTRDRQPRRARRDHGRRRRRQRHPARQQRHRRPARRRRQRLRRRPAGQRRRAHGRRRRHVPVGSRATAATSSRARTAPTRCCSTAPTARRTSTSSANGGRVRFFRNLGNIVMDLDDVEGIDLNALGGADNLIVNDVSGTDLTAMRHGPREPGRLRHARRRRRHGHGERDERRRHRRGRRRGTARCSVQGLAAAVSRLRRLGGERPPRRQRARRRRRARRVRRRRPARSASRPTWATATTWPSAVTATTRCSAATATTCCSAVPAPTRSTAAPATTS